MTGLPCKHSDIQNFDAMRCCLSCGEVISASSLATSIHTSEATAPYKYKNLDYKLGREIRLVLLLPGNSEDALWCEIIHVNMDDNPEYDAVSYTWATEDGDSRLTKAIFCIQGGSVQITMNCDAILRHLRQLGKQKLWVDAICINQTNVSERNHQVGLMDLIYTNARAVYSCIDHPADCSNLFRWLRRENPQDYRETSAWKDLTRLFSLRYFTRVWVIQEVALARLAYLVVNIDVLPLTAAVIERMKKTYDDHELPSILRWSLGRKTRLGIVSCLHTSHSSHATDPRDRVYAVMGLMEDKARSLIPVDYTLDLQVVYSNVIAAIITVRRDLGILLYSKIDHRKNSVDWRTEDLRTEDLRTEDWRTEACMDMTAFGWYLDSVMGSSHVGFTWPPHYRENTIGPWSAYVNVAILPPMEFREASEHSHISCFIERPQASLFGLFPRLRVRAHYIDSITTGHLDFTRRSTGRKNHMIVLECFRTSIWPIDGLVSKGLFLKDLFSKEKPDSKSKDLDCFLKMGGRNDSWRMFSSHFSVGYRSQDVQPRKADDIFAIDGAKALFILRKVEGQQYRIVSACYLYAAWELDCWNPGTKKGRWGPGVKRPNTEQTRMIEIY